VKKGKVEDKVEMILTETKSGVIKEKEFKKQIKLL
jgi:hypothetical protein